MQTINLDANPSIRHIGLHTDPKYIEDMLTKLIRTIKQFGRRIGDKSYNDMVCEQYALYVRYLTKTVCLIFEFDESQQFIRVVFYNEDQTKFWLKLWLSITDDPIIQYVENDRSDSVPSFESSECKLKPGEYLVHLSHCFFAYLGFTRCRLDDDSYLVTFNRQGDEMRTRLWLYYIMMHGRSWYAKFNYSPATCSVSEYELLIRDARAIKLKDVIQDTKSILRQRDPGGDSDDEEEGSGSPRNKGAELIECIRFKIAREILPMTDVKRARDCTLEEFTRAHTLDQFSDLTNELLQSAFSRDPKLNGKPYTFTWHETLERLRVVNTIQINNDVMRSFHKLEPVKPDPVVVAPESKIESPVIEPLAEPSKPVIESPSEPEIELPVLESQAEPVSEIKSSEIKPVSEIKSSEPMSESVDETVSDAEPKVDPSSEPEPMTATPELSKQLAGLDLEEGTPQPM